MCICYICSGCNYGSFSLSSFFFTIKHFLNTNENKRWMEGATRINEKSLHKFPWRKAKANEDEMEKQKFI